MLDAFAYQADALRHVWQSVSNLLVIAPTGAGKTKVGYEALKKAKKGIYVCPTRALCYEKWRELRAEFPNLRVEIANQHYPMSRSKFRSADIRVMTPFKLLDFMNNLSDFSKEVPVVVLDEVDSMEFTIETIYALLLTSYQQTRIIALSGTINDQDMPRLQAWLGRHRKCELIHSTVRPKELVPHLLRVEPLFANPDSRGGGYSVIHSTSTGTEHQTIAGVKTSQSAAVLVAYDESRKINQEPVLVWAPRRRFANDLCKELSELMPKRPSFKFRGSEHVERIRERIAALPEARGYASSLLRKVLALGIGLHHGGLLEEEQRLVEELSKDGELEMVVGCLTLSRGIHHPFGHTIIATVRDPATETASPLMDISTFHQVGGRAGRVGFGSEEAGHLWIVCQTRIDEIEVKNVLLASRASTIKSEISNKRTLTILLASLIMGDHGKRYRRREHLLTFCQNLYSAASMSLEEVSTLLDEALADFKRYQMATETAAGFELTDEGKSAARLGVHPRELLAIHALCDPESETPEFNLWIEVLGELYEQLVDDRIDTGAALAEVCEYGLAVYSQPGVSEFARPVADYTQRLLDRVQAYFEMNDISEEFVEWWRAEVYLRFILGEFKTAWAISEVLPHDGTLRRLVRSLGPTLRLAPAALDDYARLQIARCLYRQGRMPPQTEMCAVASALAISVEDWQTMLKTAVAEEV